MLTLQAASGVSLACQTITTVAVAFVLGARGQGLYVSAVALQTLLYSLLNIGVTQSTAAQIAAAAARGHSDRTADWLAFLVKLTLAFGALFIVVGALALPALGELLVDDAHVGVWAAWLCALPIVELPRAVAAVAFQGTRRMRALARLENGHALVRVFLVVVCATIAASPMGAVLGLLLSGALGSVLAFALYAEARHDGGYPLPSPSEVLARMPGVDFRRGLRLGLRLAVLKNIHVLFSNVVPRLVIGALAGLDWVAYFHVAERILGVPVLLTQGVSRTMLPALAELAGQKDMERFARLFRRVTLIAGGLVTLAIGLVLAVTPKLLDLFFPSDYGAPVFLFAWILALGYVPQAFALGVDSFFIVTNRIRALYALSILGIAVTVPINVWLILNVPVTGAAWGVTVSLWWFVVLVGYALFRLRRDRSDDVWSS